MRILHGRAGEGAIRLRAESLDDLWELSHIIDAGDTIRGRTERKISVGGDKNKQVRKPMTLTLHVTDAQLEHDVLRVQGTISEGPDDLISYGDHHSFSINAGTEFTLTKEWDSISIERLEKAASSEPLNILVIVFDRETAYLAELSRRGYTIAQTLSGDVAKKQPGGGSEDFWKTLAEATTTLDNRHHYHAIIAASPAFWNEYLLKALPQHVKKKTSTAPVGSVSEAAIKEVMTRPEVNEVLKKDRTSQEEQLVQTVLDAIATDKACYGIDETEEKTRLGQVATIIVSHNLIMEARNNDSYERLDTILRTAEQNGGKVHLVEHSTEQLDGLGGIAGVLRW